VKAGKFLIGQFPINRRKSVDFAKKTAFFVVLALSAFFQAAVKKDEEMLES